MRILITGGSGQVGRALQPALAGHEVFAPIRAIFNLEHTERIASVIATARPQLVINCAAYTAVEQAEREPDRARVVNAVAAGVIAEAASAAGAGIIHFSTDYVFDGAAARPYRESDVCAPLNVYGRTKLEGEHAVGKAGPCLTLRTSWVYAPGGRNFLRTMLSLGARRKEIRVVNDQTGSPTPAAFLARTVAILVRRMGDDPLAYLGRCGGVLHLACAGATTWHGFAVQIFAEAHRRGVPLALERLIPVTSAEYPSAVQRPAFSLLDLTRLRQEFGIEPMPWRDALSETMDQIAVPEFEKENARREPD